MRVHKDVKRTAISVVLQLNMKVFEGASSEVAATFIRMDAIDPRKAVQMAAREVFRACHRCRAARVAGPLGKSPG